MDRDYKKIIEDTENKSDMLCEEARREAREAEKRAGIEASSIREKGILKAKERAGKIISEAEEKASLMLSESRNLWDEDEKKLKKATWASSEEAASVIVGKVINL